MYKRIIAALMAALIFCFASFPVYEIKASSIVVGVGGAVAEEFIAGILGGLGVAALSSEDIRNMAVDIYANSPARPILDGMSVLTTGDIMGTRDYIQARVEDMQSLFNTVKNYVLEKFNFNSKTGALVPVDSVKHVLINGVSLPILGNAKVTYDNFDSYANYAIPEGFTLTFNGLDYVYKKSSSKSDLFHDDGIFDYYSVSAGFFRSDGVPLGYSGGIGFQVDVGKNDTSPFDVFGSLYRVTPSSFYVRYYAKYVDRNGAKQVYITTTNSYSFALQADESMSIPLAPSNAFSNSSYISNVFQDLKDKDYVDEEKKVTAKIPNVPGAIDLLNDVSDLFEKISPEQPTEPIIEPSETPTDEPTEMPTDEPTEMPTDEPTEMPTDEPTETPTDEPTEMPTDEPTETPTDEPTETPTSKPQFNLPDFPDIELPDIDIDLPDIDIDIPDKPVEDNSGIFDWLGDFFGNLLKTLKNALEWFGEILVGTGGLHLDKFSPNVESLIQTFPISIPFDLLACFALLVAEPEAPVFRYDFTEAFSAYLDTPIVIEVNMNDSAFLPVFRVFRWFEFAAFVVALVSVTRNMVRG